MCGYHHLTISQKNKRGLKFQYKWLTEYNWLSYSEYKNGAFYKYCVIFAKTSGINNQPLRQLVVIALNEWKNAKEVVEIRTNCMLFFIYMPMSVDCIIYNIYYC